MVPAHDRGPLTADLATNGPRPRNSQSGYPATPAGSPTVSGWPIDSPLAGSKKCRRLVSIASSSGCPDRTADLDETRAVHSVLPPASAAAVSSSPPEPAGG